MTALEVLEPGLLTTVQDRGRPGHAHLGVPPSGALDPPAAALANRLVGNPAGHAVLETTLTGPLLRVQAPPDGGVLVAVTGAPVDLHVDDRPQDTRVAVWVAAGSELRIGTASAGMRSYLAVRGGIATDPVLGSRAHDVLSGLGPTPLVEGDVLPVGAAEGTVPGVDPVAVGQLDTSPVLRVLPGPRDDWFADEAWEVLTGTAWEVSQDSNRVGVRLAGPKVPRRRTDQLPSEAVVTGSIQVPQDGQPVLFLADHPTTGGYPVIGVVDEASLPPAAQARPGTTLRFALDQREPR